ncbi:MAG: hypothetical protein V5B30_19320 [Candidatus Accumulibacter delftensis]
MKPVAAGFDEQGTQRGRRAPARGVVAAATAELVNPYGFRAAIAPHIAAEEEGRRIELPHIAAAFANCGAGRRRPGRGCRWFLRSARRRTDTADLAAAAGCR